VLRTVGNVLGHTVTGSSNNIVHISIKVFFTSDTVEVICGELRAVIIIMGNTDSISGVQVGTRILTFNTSDSILSEVNTVVQDLRGTFISMVRIRVVAFVASGTFISSTRWDVTVFGSHVFADIIFQVSPIQTGSADVGVISVGQTVSHILEFTRAITHIKV
jgi:hypothetical protein